jgi:filamentous hemagglutinin family protein
MKLCVKYIELACFFICFFIWLSIFPIYAAPQGGEVVSGDITINSPVDGKTTIDQTSSSGIINWQSFGIEANEHVHFNQPSANAVTLNRVIGQDVSRIMGRLTAVGKIMLVNQAGIFFGPNAVVDVAGLIATTADIDNADFLQGTYKFLQSGNSYNTIINKGQIRIKDEGIAMLLSPGVKNAGIISANLGKVVLASVAPDTSYVVDLYGDNLIHFTVRTKLAQPPQGMQSAVENTGEIYANGGRILLTAQAAKDVVHNVINSTGIIEANTIATHHGEIYLDGGENGIVSVAGNLRVRGEQPGEKGGSIKITGEQVHVGVENPATIDASGSSGGGEVLIGGGFQGGGSLPHAKVVYLSPVVSIKASATTKGEGGQIVAWSDGYTGAYGTFEAMGGALGGSGGLIETSGHYLTVTGIQVDLSAVNGETGTWLLDPWDITISAAGDGGYFPGGLWRVWQPTVNPSNINITTLTTNLAAANVVINTAGAGGGNGDITLSVPLTWSSGTILVMQADRDVIINATINATTGGGILYLTGGDTDPVGTVKINQPINVGEIIVATTNDVPINMGANITTSGDQTYSDAITLTASSILESGGDITFGSTIDGGFGLTLRTTAGGTVSTGGNIGEGAPLTAIGFADTGLAGTVDLGHNITTTGDQWYVGVNVNLQDNVILTGQYFQTLASPPTIIGNNYNLTLNFSALTIENNNIKTGVLLSPFSDINTLTVGSTGAGTLDLEGTVDEAVSYVINNAVTLIGDTTLTSSTGSGAITFDSTVNSEGAENNALTLNTTGTTTLSGVIGGTQELSSLTTNADGTTNIGANITTTGTQTYGDAVTFGVTGGRILTGSTVDFDSTLSKGIYTVFFKVSGNADFGGDVDLSTLWVTGTSNIGANITTVTTQTYDGAITLTGGPAATYTLTGVNFNPSGTITGGDNNLTLDFVESIDIDGNTIDGSGTVSGINTLISQGAGGTTLSGTINTMATNYTFDNAVTLNGSTGLGSGGTPVAGNIRFNSTINGANSFYANADGTLYFADDIGGGTPLTTFNIIGSGGATIAAGVDIDVDLLAYFIGDTDFVGATTVHATGSPGNITFGSGSTTTIGGDLTLLSDTGDIYLQTIEGNNVLTATATAGDIFVDSSIGGTNPLSSIEFTAGGNIDIGANITTSGSQTYQDALSLTSDVILTGTSFMPLVSPGVDTIVGGDNNLTLNFSGTTAITGTTINSAEFTGIGDITTGVGLTTLSNANGIINAFNNQTYGASSGTVRLLNDVELNTTGGNDITFAGDIVSSSGRDLTLDTGATGDIAFQGNAGSGARLDAITVDNARNFTISSSKTVYGTTFTQTAGTGTTDFGTSTLDMTGAVDVTTDNIIGNVNIISAGTTLRSDTLNITGFVDSQSGMGGAEAIRPDVYIQSGAWIGPGTHFFDGIDLYTLLPPVPPVPITPPIVEPEFPTKPKEPIVIYSEVTVAKKPTSCVMAEHGKREFNLQCGREALANNLPAVALMSYMRALIENPASFEARVGLIKCYLKLNMRDEAKAELKLLRQHVTAPGLLRIIDDIILKI